MSNSFSTKYSKYTLVTTADGSDALFSEAHQENTHSLVGSKEETRHNYIQGTKLFKSLNNKCINILEVGFGHGIGVLETLSYLIKHNYPGEVNFWSLEIDSQLIQWGLGHNLKDYPEIGVIKIKANGCFLELDIKKFPNFKFKVLLGDARESLPKQLKNCPPFHHIYQDAFSPKNNPTLWTLEWFSLLKRVSDPSVQMSTYSASSSVRKTLILSGWDVQNLPGLKTKKSMSVCTLTGKTASDEFMGLINSSKVAVLKD